MDVRPIPGLEHVPFAEVKLDEPDEARWREASAAARALGKTGLEVWTTDRTPAVVAFLAARGYDEARRYVISELELAAAADPGEPAFELVTLAERPELGPALFPIAAESYRDQPGRAGTRIGDLAAWRSFGLDPHPPEAFLVAPEHGRPLGYGYLELDGDTGTHGFTAVARAARGRGVAGAIKRGQIRWARDRGLRALRTANEARLEGMLALNRRLGYRPLYEEIVLRGPCA